VPLRSFVVAVELQPRGLLHFVEVLAADAHHARQLPNDCVLHVLWAVVGRFVLASVVVLLRFLLHPPILYYKVIGASTDTNKCRILATENYS